MSTTDTPNTQIEPATLPGVPNQPKTPVRSFRLSDELWTLLREIAAARGQSVTDVLRALIEEFIEKENQRG